MYWTSAIIFLRLNIISDFILNAMHKEILADKQIELLPLVKQFKKDFYLVGGTAIALHIGHRRSIDFDLFSFKNFNNQKIRTKIVRLGYKIDKVITDEDGQYTLIIDNVYFTFYNYLYKINHQNSFKKVITIPDLLALGAMKGFALGQRAKWKDYVDLFFIIKQCSYQEIANKAKQLFGNEFNEKILKVQLGYFEDINYREKVEYLPGFEVDDNIIKKFLLEVSLEK